MRTATPTNAPRQPFTRRGRLAARHTSSRGRRQRRARPSKPCLPYPSSLPPSRRACARPAPAARAAAARNTHVIRSGGARRTQTQTIRRSTVFRPARSGRRRYVAARRGGAQTHVANLSTLPHGASESPGSKSGHPGAEIDTDSTVLYTPVLLIAWHTVHIHSSASWLAGCVCASTVGWLASPGRGARVALQCPGLPRSEVEWGNWGWGGGGS